MESLSFEVLLQWLSLLSCLIAVVRLLQLKMVSSHPFFFSFLCIPLILQMAVIFFGSKSRGFFYTWMYLEPIRDISYILVVWELFSAVFRGYPGLRSLSRLVMGVAAVVASVGMVLTFYAQKPSIVTRRIMEVVRFERGTTFALVIFILILLYFISKYPIVLSRNDLVLCVLYSVWFLGDSALLFSISFLGKGYLYVANDGLALFEIVSYIGWIVLLSKDGESRQTRIRQHISPERERVLMSDLSFLNSVAFRANSLASRSLSAS